MGDVHLPGGLHRQSYSLTTGTAAGHFDDGSIAIVDNRHGKGRARLVGTMPGYGYMVRGTVEAAEWFRSLLGLAGCAQMVSHDGSDVIARLTETQDSVYLWAVNRSHEPQVISLTLGAGSPEREIVLLRGSEVSRAPAGKAISVRVNGRDASILQWRR